ncbi:phosphoglycerate dehydrogenase [Crassaminicella thermophila]|uniref:D-3-phosphoglycerate dehydrogenase n=1 Tax=Crassaminicella thermophila TaxID=2599308 RepID=A0A5C0S8H0_CRATE|nr:phosphoglycerate dehydrogenase [Crassaminicella thermophila]QEK10945.1 phosphoglycerate dehydrogenase [Crassaminicella thermophila]
MENRKKVIITERIDEEGIKLLQKHLDVDVCFNISREELLKRIHEYDAIIVRSVTKVNEELMNLATKLKVVGRAGNGTDNIDIPAATQRGIIVANTPDSNTMSAAELSIGLLMAQSRNIPQANEYIKGGKWERNRFKGVELYNKTLGIIGLGRIGSLVATRMAAFGMKVIAYDPYISDERFKRFNVEKKNTLKELIEESDFITVHTPKTKETYGMIGEREIEWMKPGVRLVNAARGGIINEKALLDGIKSGKIASAGLDVHEEEPCFNNPLFELDNVIVTPHIGASTLEAQVNVGVTVAEQVINALKGEIVPNAVNLPTMHRDELAVMKPYIELMEKLGKLYYQLYQDPIEHVNVDYWGSIAKQDTEMSTIAFIKGLLEPVVEDKVNYINAMLLAEQRGIGIEQRKMKENYNGYTDYIEIKIVTKEKTFVIAGNLSSKREGRLVKIEGYEVDVNPSKYMLFIKNMDVPGVIGHIGMILGEENINVATMQVGRNARGEQALMILTIDDEVLEKSLEKLMQTENVLWAKGVKL